MFRLINVDGRAALEHDGSWYDLATVADDAALAAPMVAVARHGELHALSERCDGAMAGGPVAAVTLDGDRNGHVVGPLAHHRLDADRVEILVRVRLHLQHHVGARRLAAARRDGELAAAVGGPGPRRLGPRLARPRDDPAPTVGRPEEETLVRRLAAGDKRRRPSDEQLLERSADLSRRFLGGLAKPVSIAWVTNQSSRWGSCTPADGTIRISARVKGMPSWVLDYVILHELTHLLQPGHGAEFWSLLQSYPRTERARGYLEGVAATAGLRLPEEVPDVLNDDVLDDATAI